MVACPRRRRPVTEVEGCAEVEDTETADKGREIARGRGAATGGGGGFLIALG
jgi:hypothetical protein